MALRENALERFSEITLAVAHRNDGADAHRSTPTGIGSSAEANASATFGYLTLLLAHLGRPYQRISVDIFNGETLTEEFARMNPMRTTPVLEVEPGRYLPESNAILVYLARGSRYLPEEPFEFAQVIRWLI